MQSSEYRYYHGWFLSFFSAKLYRDVAKHWQGTGFFYLFVLLALTWIPVIIHLGVSLMHFNKEMVPKIVEPLPQITVTNGKLSINKPVPYVLVNKETNEPVVVIDTSDEVDSLDDTPAQVLVTEDEVQVRRDNGKIEIYQIPEQLNVEFGPKRLQGWIDTLITWLLVISYPLMLLLSYGYRVIQALIYAAVGTLVFAPLCQSNLPYKAILRLAIVATTPAILISMVLSLLQISIPLELLWYFLLSMAYLLFAIRASRDLNSCPAIQEIDDDTA